MKFVFDTFGRKYSYEEQMKYLKMFSHFKLWDTCTVDIYHPDRIFCVLGKPIHVLFLKILQPIMDEERMTITEILADCILEFRYARQKLN